MRHIQEEDQILDQIFESAKENKIVIYCFALSATGEMFISFSNE
jgi:hypothetical protein